MVQRRLFLLLACVSLALLANAPSAAQEATPAGIETYRVPGFLPYAPPPKMLEVVEDRGETLRVRHLYGETIIPARPERIYADSSTLDVLVSLGLSPVAANSHYADGIEPAPLLAPLLEGIVLYPRGPANLEAIASHAPDLIVVWDVVISYSEDPAGLYALLSDIAPTIVLNENSFTYWREATNDLAEVFGRTDVAERLLTDYDQLVEAQCKRIRTTIGPDETITFVDYAPDSIWLLSVGFSTEGEFIVPISANRWAYETCRLLPGEEVLAITGADGDNVQLSEEQIPSLRADHVMLFVPPGGAVTDDGAEHLGALWQALPAYENGTLYVVPTLLNTSYYGALHTFEQRANVIAGVSDE